MSEKPLVSFGMPVYNGQETIREALESLVKQTYQNIEIIIADDRSTDDTAKICKEYADKYPHITFIQNEKNLGAFDNFVSVMNQTKGKYFVWTSQDDIWLPEYTSKLAGYLEENPEYVAALCATKMFWEDTKEERYTVKLTGKDSPQDLSYLKNALSIVTKKAYGKEKTSKNNTFIHGVVRRDVFVDSVVSYPVMVVNERQHVLIMALAGKLYFLDETLFEKSCRRRPRHEDLPEDAYTKNQQARSGAFCYSWDVLRAVIRSKTIPCSRKILLPVIIGAILKTYWLMPLYYKFLGFIRDGLPEPLYALLNKIRKR